MDALTVDWDTPENALTVSDWNRHLKRIRYSSVFQNWAYGEASAKHDGFKILRGAVRRRDTVVGLVQAFTRRSFWGGRSVRILRAPVFDDTVPIAEQIAVLAIIKRQFPLLRANWCTIMPELPDLPLIRRTLPRFGLFQVMVGYQTLWLDLTQTEDALWQGLNGKWRNQARKAMTADMDITFDEDPSWLLDRYGEHVQAVGYHAPAADILRQLDADDVSVAIARLNGTPVAGTLFVHHGVSATYQVGWTNEQGRALNAHNLLLWRHLLHAKNKDVQTLDLGGVDPVTAPGVAHFKAGLGGTPFTHAGTFV